MQSLREAPFARSVFARRIEQDRANHSRFGRATSHPTTNYLGSRLRSANRDIAEGGQPMAAPRWFAAGAIAVCVVALASPSFAQDIVVDAHDVVHISRAR